MTSKVLVPYDGSEMSDKALDKAIEFSKALKSEMIILHILDERLIPSNAARFIGEKSAFEDAKMTALNILKVGAEAMLKYKMEKVKANGINVRIITGVGAPAEGIIDVAENEGVPPDVCSLPKCTIGMAYEQQFPDSVAMVTSNMPCDGGMSSYTVIERELKIPTFRLDIPFNFYNERAGEI